MSLYDLHSHILPALDDGASNIEETKELIKMLKAQGVCGSIVTPHFFANVRSIDKAVRERDRCFWKTCEIIGADYPLVAGFEVRVFNGISRCEDLQSLRLGNSKYILLELPFDESITEHTAEEIVSMSLTHGLMPIMAHIERYMHCRGFENLCELIHDGFAIGQLSASSFSNVLMRKRLCGLIYNGLATVVASDAHSPETRPPQFDVAKRVIEKRLSEDTYKTLCDNSEKIFNEICNS